MSKKIKKSSVKKGKSAKKTPAKKVFANKKTAAKKAVKKPAPAKKTATISKASAKTKAVKTTAKSNGKLKTTPKAAVKSVSKAPSKPVAKPVSKSVAKTVKPQKTVAVKTNNKKTDIKNKPAADLTAKVAKNISSPIKTKASGNNKPVPAPKAEAKNVYIEENDNTNDPPGKFELEYVIHSSAELLFNFLTEPSGLSEWFCDDVNIRHGIFTFFWDGTQQQAQELKFVPDKLVRFHWIDRKDDSYFEFRIEKDELTSDISLIITDFAETEEERKSSKLLWDSQIDKLLHVMGAYF